MKTGDTLAGRYRLLERIGAGGMGEVWRAEQAPLGRAVAVKVIPREQDQPGLRERFAREAELAAKVDHRNVVDIIEYGVSDDGDPYLVMPMLKGESLAVRLARTPSPTLGEVLAWMRAILSGLAAIHDEGIVHRDLKPGNVLLAEDADGVVPKLLDFGISRSSEGPKRGSLTQLGTAMGTPEYMAPEQFESARDVDHRADLYGVGAILYEAMAGHPPFQAPDAFAIYRAILQGDPPSLATLRPDLPDAVVALVHRALEKDPDARFPDARAMRDTIDGLATAGVLDAAATATLDRALRSRAELGAADTSPVMAPTMALAPGARASTPKTVAMEGHAPSTPKTHLMGAEATEALSPPPRGPAAANAVSAASAANDPPLATAPAGRFPWIAVAVVMLALGGGAAYGLGLFDARDDGASVSGTVSGTVSSPPADPVGTSEATRGQRVAGPERLSTLALAWARLGASERALDVRLAPSAGRWVMIAGPDVGAPDATRLATALGASAPEPAAWDDAVGLRPALLASTVRLNVHAEPAVSSPTLRVLPHDTVVVGLYGTIDEQPSSPDGDGAITYFVVSPNESGWALARFLTPFSGCLPALERFGADVGGDASATLADALFARTHAYLLGLRADVQLVTSRDRRAARSTVALYRAGAGCELGEPLALHRLDGVLDEVFFTETAPASGQSLLVLSWYPGSAPPSDGVLEWSAYGPEDEAPVWIDRLPSAAFLTRRRRGDVSGSRDRVVRSQREHYALSVRRPGEARVFYRWDEIELVPADGRPPGDTASSDDDPSATADTATGNDPAPSDRAPSNWAPSDGTPSAPPNPYAVPPPAPPEPE